MQTYKIETPIYISLEFENRIQSAKIENELKLKKNLKQVSIKKSWVVVCWWVHGSNMFVTTLPNGRFYFVGLHKTRHGKKLQRPENESVKPFNKAYNGALWRKHHTTRHKESNYHSYGLPNVCNNGHQDKFKNVVTIFPFSPGILLYGMEFHQHSLVHFFWMTASSTSENLRFVEAPGMALRQVRRLWGATITHRRSIADAH